MDPDLVLTSSEKTVRFRKCLRKSNNCTKRISKHATPSTHSNVSKNVKDRLTELLNPTSKTGIETSIDEIRHVKVIEYIEFSLQCIYNICYLSL